MKFFDTFSFFNEIDLLWLRVNELKELNPIHVLVESKFTHTGDPKPLYFEENKEKFKDFNIRHIVVGDMPNDGDAWHNEKYQRNCSILGLYDCEDDDVVGIFDLDEIPKPSSVALYKPEMGIVGVKMDKMSYFLNCIEGYQQWEVGRLLTFGMLKNSNPSDIRNGGFQTVMCEAGWHMSFMGGYEKMVEKLYAYAHTETVTADLMSNLKRKYETGESLWGTDFWRFVKIDSTFPKYLFEHQEEFKHLIKQI